MASPLLRAHPVISSPLSFWRAATGHIHLAELAAHANCFRNRRLVLLHFSSAYSVDEIQRIVADTLPDWVSVRCVLDQKHNQHGWLCSMTDCNSPLLQNLSMCAHVSHVGICLETCVCAWSGIIMGCVRTHTYLPTYCTRTVAQSTHQPRLQHGGSA